MNRLTSEERRRAAELRRTSVSRQPRAVALAALTGPPETRARSGRIAALVSIAIGGALLLHQLGQQLSLYGPGSLLDWLLPRL